MEDLKAAKPDRSELEILEEVLHPRPGFVKGVGIKLPQSILGYTPVKQSKKGQSSTGPNMTQAEFDERMAMWFNAAKKINPGSKCPKSLPFATTSSSSAFESSENTEGGENDTEDTEDTEEGEDDVPGGLDGN